MVTPVLLGLGLAALFVAGGLVVREIGFLDDQVRSVLDFADEGAVPLLLLITAVNGVAEELFFRGAAYAAVTRYPVPVTTVAYVLATLATGNVMLASRPSCSAPWSGSNAAPPAGSSPRSSPTSPGRR